MYHINESMDIERSNESDFYLYNASYLSSSKIVWYNDIFLLFSIISWIARNEIQMS